ncbi:MAG: AMP-binding protein, partial [Nocardioidaceae bacterium]|nr:AMP-binding protein [Nocardioidaceae bacterium]
MNAREPHLSHSAGPTDSPLLTETIGQNFAATVRTYPDREALVECATGRRWTYTQLETAVDAVALGLVTRGVHKGDRVGIWAPNCAEWVLVQYATARIGAILVNVNPAYRTHEVEFVLKQSGVRLLIATPTFKTSNYAEMIDDVAPRCPELLDIVLIGEDTWDSLVEEGERADDSILAEIESTLSADEAINIQYTSGTTGFPKGATLSHRNILNNGWYVGELVDYSEVDRICIPVPFYHCFGMVMGNLAATTHGAAMIIPAPAFDPALTLKAAADEECTSLYGVPT